MSVKKRAKKSVKKAVKKSAKTTVNKASTGSAETELQTLVAKFTPEELRLVAAMRRSLQKRLPTAYEVVYEYRDCFVISYSPSEHGYEGVLAIRGSADGVRLYFNSGKELPDPSKVLHGSSKTRWIEMEGASTLARPEVARLIEEAIAHNRVPFARTGRGSIVLRLKAAKQRGKRRPA